MGLLAECLRIDAAEVSAEPDCPAFEQVIDGCEEFLFVVGDIADGGDQFEQRYARGSRGSGPTPTGCGC